MNSLHLVLAVLVTLVWGFNFVAVIFALEEFSPLLLVVTRLFLTSIPAIFFVKKPEAPLSLVALYGLTMFALQFGLCFMGIYAGVTPGLGSILMQLQIFFSIFLAMLVLKEKLGLWQLIGACVSFTGIILVGMNVGGEVTWSGVMLIVGAAASWGAGNLISKKMGKVNTLSLVIWGSAAAWPMLLCMSLAMEGGVDNLLDTFQNVTWVSGGAVLYITLLSTLFAYGVWSWLLGIYPLGVIAPFTLLVPIFGIISSVWILDEELQPWKISAAVLVISGLCINMFGSKLQLAWNQKKLGEERSRF